MIQTSANLSLIVGSKCTEETAIQALHVAFALLQHPAHRKACYQKSHMGRECTMPVHCIAGCSPQIDLPLKFCVKPIHKVFVTRTDLQSTVECTENPATTAPCQDNACNLCLIASFSAMKILPQKHLVMHNVFASLQIQCKKDSDTHTPREEIAQCLVLL